MIQSKSSHHSYEVYGILWVTRKCEAHIADLLANRAGIPMGTVQRGLHLTVYYGRRPLTNLDPHSRPVKISADVSETRFMVLAPGGENPRPNLEPGRRSVGIRLTKRNPAIKQVLELRRSIYRLEPAKWPGNRKSTTDWNNAFGSRHYQPHIKLLRPGSGVGRDLTEIGEMFRSSINRIEFGKFQIMVRQRI